MSVPAMQRVNVYCRAGMTTHGTTENNTVPPRMLGGGTKKRAPTALPFIFCRGEFIRLNKTSFYLARLHKATEVAPTGPGCGQSPRKDTCRGEFIRLNKTSFYLARLHKATEVAPTGLVVGKARARTPAGANLFTWYAA